MSITKYYARNVSQNCSITVALNEMANSVS